MPGIGISVFLIAIGAILDFAVTINTTDHGVNLNTVGLILMIDGAVGLVLSLAFWGGGAAGWYGPRRRRTIVDDGRGNVVRREDTYR